MGQRHLPTRIGPDRPIAAPPTRRFRGRSPGALRPRVIANIERLGASIDGPAITARFVELTGVDDGSDDSVWLHGDLHSADNPRLTLMGTQLLERVAPG